MIRVGIDIGNSKISCIVSNIKSGNNIKILSFISQPTNNIKKSVIINLDLLKHEVKEIINLAAKESHTDIHSVRLNLPMVDSFSSYSNNEISILNEKISELHLKKTINKSDLFEPIDNYRVIHRSIINYEIDQNNNIDNPIGMYGDILKLNFYKLAIRENYIKSISTIFDQINIHVENYIPSPLSSALATLKKDEKELDCICIDLGFGSTGVSVFVNNHLIFVDAIPIGGQNITNDLAKGISTTIESAERLKTLYGSVITNPSDEHELIDVPILGSDSSELKQINLSEVNSIIKPRVEETLELIRQKLKEYNLHNKQIRNLVLTGGGSLLDGIDLYAQKIFDSKTRLAKPSPLIGVSEKYSKPQFSQTIGLILYNTKDYEIDFLSKKLEKIKKNSILSQFSTWLDKYI